MHDNGNGFPRSIRIRGEFLLFSLIVVGIGAWMKFSNPAPVPAPSTAVVPVYVDHRIVHLKVSNLSVTPDKREQSALPNDGEFK